MDSGDGIVCACVIANCSWVLVRQSWAVLSRSAARYSARRPTYWNVENRTASGRRPSPLAHRSGHAGPLWYRLFPDLHGTARCLQGAARRCAGLEPSNEQNRGRPSGASQPTGWDWVVARHASLFAAAAWGLPDDAEERQLVITVGARPIASGNQAVLIDDRTKSCCCGNRKPKRVFRPPVEPPTKTPSI